MHTWSKSWIADFRKKFLFFLGKFLLLANLPLTPTKRGSLEMELFIVVRIVH